MSSARAGAERRSVADRMCAMAGKRTLVQGLAPSFDAPECCGANEAASRVQDGSGKGGRIICVPPPPRSEAALASLPHNAF